MDTIIKPEATLLEKWKEELASIDNAHPGDFIPLWIELRRKVLICNIINHGPIAQWESIPLSRGRPGIDTP